jgi:hypothetical protein
LNVGMMMLTSTACAPLLNSYSGTAVRTPAIMSTD